MLFSELYSAYYNAVAAILKEALDSPIPESRILQIAKDYAFGESFLAIQESLKSGAWPLLKPDRTSVIRNRPEMPLTVLQKRWLKAISLDPRMRLFGIDLPDFPDVEPLFRQEDVCVFDKYADGDPYSDEEYVRHFRLILDAIRNRYPLEFIYSNRKEKNSRLIAQPERLEYSEKDDKFRIVVSGCVFGDILNVGRIISCRPAQRPLSLQSRNKKKRTAEVVLEVADERNALERVLLHFAHLAKEAERIDEDHYRVKIEYDRDDETEMVIRILQFGQFVKVLTPEDFRNLIIDRLKRQKTCENSCEP